MRRGCCSWKASVWACFLIPALTARAGDRLDPIWLVGGHSGNPTVFLSPDESRLIATGGEKVWRIGDGVLEQAHAQRSLGRAMSPDGRFIAGIAPRHEIDLWRLADGEVVQTLTGHTDTMQDLAFSPDGALLASSSRDRTVRLWRLSDGQSMTLVGHTDMTRKVRFSPDGALVASSSQDRTVRLWRVADGAHLGSLVGHGDYVNAVAFSPDATLLATTSGDETVRVWRVADQVLLATLAGHEWPPVAVEFTPDGAFVVSSAIDRTIRIWRLSDYTLERTIAVDAYPSSLAMFADGQRVAVGTDENPRILQLADGREVARFGAFTGPITSVAVSPDGAWVAAAEPDIHEERLHILRAKTGDVVSTMTIGDRSRIEDISPLALSPDWSMFATRHAGGLEIYIRSLDDGALLHTLTGHVSVIYELRFSPDGQYIASAGEYQSGLWRVADGTHIRFFENDFATSFHSVTFSPDGSVVAAGAIDEGRIWRVDDGSPVAEFQQPGAFFIETLAFSADGALLASGGLDGSVHLFRAADGALVRALAGHDDLVTHVEFSRDGRRLFSGSMDGRIRVWDTARGTLLTDYDRGTGRNVMSLALMPNERAFVYSSSDILLGLAHSPYTSVGNIAGTRVRPR